MKEDYYISLVEDLQTVETLTLDNAAIHEPEMGAGKRITDVDPDDPVLKVVVTGATTRKGRRCTDNVSAKRYS